jgi:hypothetical protein
VIDASETRKPDEFAENGGDSFRRITKVFS